MVGDYLGNWPYSKEMHAKEQNLEVMCLIYYFKIFLTSLKIFMMKKLGKK